MKKRAYSSCDGGLGDRVAEDHLRPTRILDHEHEPVQQVVREVVGKEGRSPQWLREAHQIIQGRVSPVYTVDEFQPASVTLIKGVGSCSQRFACLEAVARASGIATRVRALWIDGRFWYSRFRLSRPFIPKQILLAWPQFFLNEQWIGGEQFFGSLAELAQAKPTGFTNADESLFEGISRTAIDWEGRTAASCPGGHCDLSRYVLSDVGCFATRDELFIALPNLQDSLRGKVFEFIYGGRKSAACGRPSGSAALDSGFF